MRGKAVECRQLLWRCRWNRSRLKIEFHSLKGWISNPLIRCNHIKCAAAVVSCYLQPVCLIWRKITKVYGERDIATKVNRQTYQNSIQHDVTWKVILARKRSFHKVRSCNATWTRCGVFTYLDLQQHTRGGLTMPTAKERQSKVARRFRPPAIYMRHGNWPRHR